MTLDKMKGSRRTRRGSLVAAIIATVAITATGCSAPAPAEPDGPVTLSFLNWSGSEDATKDNLAKVIAAFEAENPNITIENVAVPFDQLRTQALTQFAAGDPPDIIQLSQNVPFELASEDLLLDMSAEGFADQEWLDAHAGVGNGTVDDKFIAAPWAITPYALWYDKELMTKAGLDPENPPATLEDLISQSEEARDVLAAEGAYPIGIDTTSADNVLFQYLHFMYMFGAAPLEGGVANFDTPEVIDSLQFLQDAVANDLTPTGQGIRQLRELQANGKIMFRMDGPFVAGIYRSLNPALADEAFFDRFGVAGIPLGESGDNGAVFNGLQLSIAADSEHPEEAWAFVQYLIDSDVAVNDLILPLGAIPSLTSATEIPAFEERLSPTVAQTYVNDVIPRLQTAPYGAIYADAATIIIRAMQEVAINGQDPATIAEQTDAQLAPLFVFE